MPLPLSPVLRPALPLVSLTTLTMPTPALVASPIDPSIMAATAPETTSAAGGDSTLNSPSEPDLEPEAEPEVETDAETEEEKARRLLYCSLCKVAVNSASQLDAHNSGTKHKTMLEARTGVGSIKSFPRPGVKSKLAPVVKSLTGLQNKTFHCETCDVHVNSETQLKQICERFDYVVEALSSHPLTTVTPSWLVCLQVPTDLYKFSHTTPLLRSIQWVPGAARIHFKTLVLAYHAVKGSGPSYIQDMVKPYTPAHARRPASANRLVATPSLQSGTRFNKVTPFCYPGSSMV
ncbi:zinc finger protein 385D-like [Notothenia coriiceps]|uniref:Zinc finger protein 385D-like n=1 Tax=Notothenia coriiceps TaxID=8208 RepID=A0A6I9NQD2_9TELE|nr:PREDICTED: zinc finger protein 385D-like [Notothenia coriiceps]